MFLSHLSDLKHLDTGWNDLSQATDWFQAINMIPSLISLNLDRSFLPLMFSPPPSLANSSKFLEAIYFSGNGFTSSIFPWLFNFNNSLAVLRLSENQLQGPIPDAFGAFVSLKELNFAYNHFTGNIPRSLSNLCSLETLDLSVNNLTGEVPNLQNFSSIRELRLGTNNLNGTYLTQSVGLLSNLEVLDLSSNSLSGVVSDVHFLSLSKLWTLDFLGNSFTMNLSSNWVPPFQLKILKLRSCKLGPHFPQWVRTQKSITNLDISNAGISDVINDWFWEHPPILRYLNLSSNSISGEIRKLPSILDNDQSIIDMSSNHFDGTIPQLHPSINVLDLSRNRLSGTISHLCSTSGASVSYLDLSRNSLSGEIPDCWSSISTTTINLGYNNFSGTVPASFGQIRCGLMSLHLRNNSLSGELPPSLGNCTSLTILDVGENRLSGSIPAWIGQSLSDLVVLRLRSNRFHGTIPTQICSLSSLQILDLPHNYISGSIPWCVSNFTVMANKSALAGILYQSGSVVPFGFFRVVPFVEFVVIQLKGIELEYGRTLGLVKCIDLSSNNLNGKIPGEITSLEGLISLNLSLNQLNGVIPSRIKHMDSLESLDLSANHLSGRIPEELGDLNFLSYLNLSHNNLSGKIPSSTQLQSFENTSYEGNAGLCGKPLSNICPGEDTDRPSINVDEEQGKDEIISSGFYLGMGAGFAAGFWAFCGCLLLYRPWRHVYFRFFDIVGDWFYVRILLAVAKLQRIF